MRPRLTVVVAVLGIVAAPGLGAAQGTSVPPKYVPDATLASTPANVVWGYIVDFVQMVYAAIPKKIFKKNPEYWLKR